MHYLPMKRIAIPMLVLLCAACLPGCALLNPHLTVPRASTETMVFAGELGDAISEANQLRTAYHDAVGTTSLARNGLALTLIPLSDRLRMVVAARRVVIQVWDVDPKEPWPDGRDRTQDEALPV